MSTLELLAKLDAESADFRRALELLLAAIPAPEFGCRLTSGRGCRARGSSQALAGG